MWFISKQMALPVTFLIQMESASFYFITIMNFSKLKTELSIFGKLKIELVRSIYGVERIKENVKTFFFNSVKLKNIF